ncbi:hypothetical protein Sgleb_72720 [Streptomyces glebosus]|uniref:Uncharacterized protein n=1 Tax=Streptomyces glebosus TaxID=249580 RepID=A0A640TC32_9ACTN|nr:hypothetical protein Sgleb_72720 [Streptomyces glebosus]GHG78814.1 hypothetical protein GCM10010513_55610 [Streptomyces glebosus]
MQLIVDDTVRTDPVHEYQSRCHELPETFTQLCRWVNGEDNSVPSLSRSGRGPSPWREERAWPTGGVSRSDELEAVRDHDLAPCRGEFVGSAGTEGWVMPWVEG